MKFALPSLFIVLLSTSLSAILVPACAQAPNERSLHIKKATGKIVLDGILDEEDWQVAQVAGNFWQQFPYDTSAAVQQSEARMTFDDEFLYVSFVVYQPRKYAVQSLRRDFPQGGGTDLIFINLDTFRDKQNAFHFAVNPYGVQREGLIANGDNITNDWDNKWYTQVTNYDDRWIVESSIPFKTLRYKVTEGTNIWNVNFFRNNLSINERSSWSHMPRGFRGNNIAFTSPLIWDTPPPQPAGNISLIPYASLNSNRDYLNERPGSTRPGIGLDAKIAITTGLNLDLTINPDFAQAEVDRQVTNLSRFELFFPERRQFFLENSDLFAGFGVGGVVSSSTGGSGGGGGGGGNSVVTPFFSRRIGIARDTVSGNNVIIPILGGARLSGKVTNRLRVGLLSMQTAHKEGVQASANYSVLSVQQRVFSRSTIGIIMASKQDFDSKRDQPLFSSGFNRVIGLDYNLASRDGRLNGKIFAHKSFTPQNPDDALAMAALFEYSSPRLSFTAGASRIGSGYNVNQIGFVPRNDIWRSNPQLEYSFFPKNPRFNSIVNSWGFGFDSDIRVQASTGRLTDWDFSPVQFFVRFVDNSLFRFTPLRTDYTYLFDRSFDPSNRGNKPLPRGSEYRYRSTRFSYQSNPAKLFSVILMGRIGEYFNGNITSLSSSWMYRYQPYANLSVDFNYNNINLPEKQGYADTQLILVGPRLDLTFSKSVFLTTVVQYNNQINNINLNTRFQWRFKPVSDFFVVYTDNYFASYPDHPYNLGWMNSKNRALVVKLTYWLNV
ncbi:DUF5916 domain-containing protein [Telluribacter sp.]|jgi:hypothetical protein|uniref:DUF5916 domain-containing protein n=1 Tax=Telluribacter sp. TaxID=1978767 RepID=UPI002E0DA32F|nr:DUF5916 domain-containing protein [Telluribacter sp.]